MEVVSGGQKKSQFLSNSKGTEKLVFLPPFPRRWFFPRLSPLFKTEVLSWLSFLKKYLAWHWRGFHVEILTQHGVEVAEDTSWLHSEWMDISNALNIDSTVLQEILNLIRFCQNSYCITENKNTGKNQCSTPFNWLYLLSPLNKCI